MHSFRAYIPCAKLSSHFSTSASNPQSSNVRSAACHSPTLAQKNDDRFLENNSQWPFPTSF